MIFRCELKNVCNIIFYSLPKNDFIFKNKVKCIFSKYDAFFLEKIVGTEGMKEFLAEYNKASTFIV